MLRALGIEAHSNGPHVVSRLSTFTIILECTFLFISNIYVSAILAYPSSVKAKFLGICFGLPALFLVNTIRIVSLAFVSRYFPRHLDMAHYLVWQALLVILIASFWIYWCSSIAQAKHVP
jgi:exosortase/archaeosortase family protein